MEAKLKEIEELRRHAKMLLKENKISDSLDKYEKCKYRLKELEKSLNPITFKSLTSKISKKILVTTILKDKYKENDDLNALKDLVPAITGKNAKPYHALYCLIQFRQAFSTSNIDKVFALAEEIAENLADIYRNLGSKDRTTTFYKVTNSVAIFNPHEYKKCEEIIKFENGQDKKHKELISYIAETIKYYGEKIMQQSLTANHSRSITKLANNLEHRLSDMQNAKALKAVNAIISYIKEHFHNPELKKQMYDCMKMIKKYVLGPLRKVEDLYRAAEIFYAWLCAPVIPEYFAAKLRIIYQRNGNYQDEMKIDRVLGIWHYCRNEKKAACEDLMKYKNTLKSRNWDPWCNRKIANAYFDLGRCRTCLEEYEKSIKMYLKALAKNPKPHLRANCYDRISFSFEKMENYEQSNQFKIRHQQALKNVKFAVFESVTIENAKKHLIYMLNLSESESTFITRTESARIYSAVIPRIEKRFSKSVDPFHPNLSYQTNEYIIKMLNEPKKAYKEFKILKRLSKFPQFLKVYGLAYDSHTKKTGIIMEQCVMTLKDYFKWKGSSQFLTVLKQLLEGFIHLKRKRIVHADIKPENILIDSKGNCKLVDFGSSFSVTIADYSDTLKTTHATVKFLAPEVYFYLNQQMGNYFGDCFKCEVYSLGLCLLSCLRKGDISCLNCIDTFSDSEEIDCLKKYYSNMGKVSDECRAAFIRSSQRLQYTVEYRLNQISREIKGIELLDSMLKVDPEERLSFDDLQLKLSLFL
jgi:serine/threonine protein kinase